MNPDLSNDAVILIEKLCARGCTEVNQMLEAARHGNAPAELDHFPEKQRLLIMEELTAIMAVYKRQSDKKT
jgi:hypothetical protein